jgi:hypothetical protein
MKDVDKSENNCEKCGGAGWLWWHELKEYSGPASDPHDCYSDDTKYSCDACHGTGKLFIDIDYVDYLDDEENYER